MHFSLHHVAILLAGVAAAAPTSSLSSNDLVAREDRRGSYTVSGLGSRKQAILQAGGNTLDIAIAMLETENMQTNYAYGKLVKTFSPYLLLHDTDSKPSQETTRVKTLPTSDSSSRTGACSAFVRPGPDLWASHNLIGTMELS
jgi:hypothetical protein